MTTASEFLMGNVDKPSTPIPPGVLKGPAEADHYRMKVGRYRERWYIDPLPACDIAPASEQAWPSFSHIKKAHGQDWTYTSYRRIARALDADYDCLKGLDADRMLQRMLEINKADMNRAFQRGTNVHLYLEMALRGNCDPTFVDGPDEPGAEYMPAVKQFLDAYQPELVAAEFVYIGRDLNGVGYGGTADCLLRIDGTVYDVDWKTRGATSDHGCYAEEAAQVVASATADYWIVEGDTGGERQRPSAIDSGLIVSIKPDGVRLYPIDIAKATPYFHNLHAWWVAQKEDRLGIGRQLAPRKAKVTTTPPVLANTVTLEELVATAADEQALGALWQQHKDRWTPALTELAKKRKGELS